MSERDGDRLNIAYGELLKVRAQRRSDADAQIALLEEAEQEIRDLLADHESIDPISGVNLITVRLTDARVEPGGPTSGKALLLEAFGGEYSAALQINYEHGALLFAPVVDGSTDFDEKKWENFALDVFRGMPIGLRRGNDGEVLILCTERGTSTGLRPVTVWVALFTEAVLTREKLRSSGIDRASGK